MSIWDGIDRKLVEEQIKKLEIEAPVQDISNLPSITSSSLQPTPFTYPEHFLPILVESQLTTYFSFIAAWTNHPRDVAAATLQHHTDPDSLRLFLAANEGVQPAVQEAFHSLVGVLQECATRSPSKRNRDRYARRCLRIIVSLHRDRIFWRLGSKKARGQRNDKAWPGVADRIRYLRTVRLKPLTRRPGDATTLSHQIFDLENKIEAAEQCTGPGCADEEIKALEAVIHAAQEISSDDRTIITRLQHLHIPTNRREYRYIQVLSNYWTISRYLSKVALHYPTWFTNLTLITPPSNPSPQNAGEDYCIHAEIQLLLHHEQHPTTTSSASSFPPRYISSNKQACFLCYCFIRAHGKYCVSGSHGHVHHQWTVILPEDSGIDSERRVRLNEALKGTVADVQSALRNATATRALRYIDPAQSVLKLVEDQLRSPSQSTIASVSIRPQLAVSEKDGDGVASSRRSRKWVDRCKTYIQRICCMGTLTEEDSSNGTQSMDKLGSARHHR